MSKLAVFPAELKAKMLADCRAASNFEATSKTIMDEDTYKHLLRSHFNISSSKQVYQRLCRLQNMFPILMDIKEHHHSFVEHFHELIWNNDAEEYWDFVKRSRNRPDVRLDDGKLVSKKMRINKGGSRQTRIMKYWEGIENIEKHVVKDILSLLNTDG